MAVAPTYALTLDERTWLPVPLRFPWGDFGTPEEWADELSDSLLDGIDVASEVRAQLRETALLLQAMPGPLPGALERFWRTEYVGGPTIVAHLYVTDIDDSPTVEGLLQLARAGIGGFVQTWSILDETEFDTAIAAVVVTEIEGRAVAAQRHLGIRDGHVFLLDYLEEDPLILEAVQGELGQIFRSIRFA